MTEPWPFAGRDTLLTRCGDLLASPRVHAVVLVGGAGIGKTRLIDECCRRAMDAGFGVLRASAHRGSASIPFGALAPLLPAGDEMVASGVPLLRQAGDALAAAAPPGRPLLLAIDDAHVLDDASAVLLHQLATGRRIFVLASVRSDERAPEAVTALWRDGIGERLDVPPLGRDEIGDVVAAALGGVVAPALVDALARSSGGNPLVLRELVRGSLEAGALVDQRGLWRLGAALVPSAPLHELHAERLARIDRARRAALDVIAVGEPLGLQDAEALGGVAVEALERDGLVVGVAAGRRTMVQVGEPSLGDVLRSGVPMLRGRTIRRELAQRVLAAGARRRGDVLRAAIFLTDAGAPAPRHVLATAAREAFFAHDVATAERLALAAEDIEHDAETAHVLAAARYRQGAGASSAADHARDDRERALRAMNRAAVQFWHEGARDDADRTLAAAVESGETDAWRDELIATGANFDVNAGWPYLALQRLDGVEPAGGRPLVMASLVRSLALPHIGRAADALLAVEAGRAAYDTLHDQLELFQRALFVSTESAALFEMGRLQDAVDVAHAGYRAAATDHDTAGQAFSALVLGRALVARGRAASALRWFREAHVLFDAIGHRGPARWALGGVALAAVLRGDVTAAAAALDRLDAAPSHPAQMLETDIERARAWVAVARSDPVAARSVLRRAADHCRERSLAALETVVLHDLARLGGAKDGAARVAALSGGWDDGWSATLAADVQAIARRDADGLATSSARLASLGADLLAAESAIRAAGAYAADGRQRDAAAWRRRAADMLAGCEGARTPGLADAGGPVPLTDREREIALLAASGLTSKAISERLILSVRTVDNNLARVYGKLGIGDRSGIAGALGIG